MQELMGSQALIKEHIEHNQQYNPNSYSSRERKNIVSFQEGQYPASPKFYRQTKKGNQYFKSQYNQQSHSNNIIDSIKPYVDDILADQNVNSKQVQRGLDQLRIIQQKMMAMVDNQELSVSQGINQEQNRYQMLVQIQRTVDLLIANAEQESTQFKATLQHLKNVNNSIFNGAEEQEEQEDNSQYERIQRIESKTHKVPKSSNLNDFFEGIQNLQQRLFNEIMILREQKDEAINLFQNERQRFIELERKYQILERQYNKVLNRQNIDQSKIDFGDFLRQNDQPSYSNIRVNQENPERYFRPQITQRVKRGNNQNIRKQINNLQNKLKAADLEHNKLQNEIRHYKNQPQSNNKFSREVQLLNSQLAASQRKAATLFPYKIENDRIVQELKELRYQNQQLQRQGNGYRSIPQSDKYLEIYSNANDEFSDSKYAKNNKFSNNSDRLNDYRQVLQSIRGGRK